jgi:hypothetical protein
VAAAAIKTSTTISRGRIKVILRMARDMELNLDRAIKGTVRQNLDTGSYAYVKSCPFRNANIFFD